MPSARQTFGDKACHSERERRIWLAERRDSSLSLRMTAKTPLKAIHGRPYLQMSNAHLHKLTHRAGSATIDMLLYYSPTRGCTMHHYVKSSNETLRKRGYRLTPQRYMILSVIQEAEAHLSIDQIAERVQQ